MDYEKKYNEALEDMRAIYPNLKGDAKLAVEHAFPELAESEDERIRKKCIAIISKWTTKEDRDECIAYLEKQKEQKPAEWSKEETKDLVHILKVLDDCYAYGKHDLSKTDHDNLTSTIKSLRPSWKPSEEQIYSLGTVVKGMSHVSVGSVGYNLKGLYEQLKKLM